ncbi:MAG: SAM-dependent methyltransferase [Flavobacteriales bacterium]|nr:MAG: SAM-dependent methyltransferase [Flavobacteriales bacterium]
MILYILNKTFLKKIYFKKWGKKWVKNKISPFLEFLEEGDTILDVGSGNGLVSWELMQLGYKVIPLDIASQEFDSTVKPIVYNGSRMPFEDKKFDVALLLSVLHHTENPEEILKEVGRVAKRIIINEDIYNNKFQKYLTLVTDSVVNLGYSPCPRTNKNDTLWKDTFLKFNYQLIDSKYNRILFFFKQAIYHLKADNLNKKILTN